VTFLDSSGLRALIAAHDRHDAASRRLVIKEPASPVVRVLEITGLLGTLNIET
jgi:anti-anti-sigma factor